MASPWEMYAYLRDADSGWRENSFWMLCIEMGRRIGAVGQRGDLEAADEFFLLARFVKKYLDDNPDAKKRRVLIELLALFIRGFEIERMWRDFPVQRAEQILRRCRTLLADLKYPAPFALPTSHIYNDTD